MRFGILIITALVSPIYTLLLNSSTHIANSKEFFPSYSNHPTVINKNKEQKYNERIDTHRCSDYAALIESYKARPSDCKGILFGSIGNVTSSGYPESLPSESNCLWIICGHPNQTIRLVWYEVTLDKATDDLKVYTEIPFDINTWNRTRNPVYMDIKAKSQAYEKTFSPPLVAIEFISSGSGVKRFVATYWILDEEPDCEMEYFGESGIINSPRYPEDYISRFPCIWKIFAPLGRRIELNIIDFMSEAVMCEDGYLEIRDGALATSPLIKTICDVEPTQAVFKSDANSMWIGYFSAIPHSAFKLFWDATKEACGWTYINPSGVIESPDYSGSLSRSTNPLHCEWRIIANEGSTIELEFVDIFQLNSASEECGCSEIEVYDGTQHGYESKLLTKICSNHHHNSVHSSTEYVTIIFYQKMLLGNCKDHASLSRNVGFKIKYNTVTSRVLTGFDGIIESFNYPTFYPSNLNISWIIEVSEGNSVDFNFTDFRLEDGDSRRSCRWDYVEVSDWDRYKKDSEVSSLGKFCGSGKPEINALGDTVMINLVTDSDRSAEGFRLVWTEKGFSGCVQTIAVIDNQILHFSTQKHPLKYSNNAKCRWRLQASKGSRLKLRLENAEIECEESCKYDVLKVHDGRNERSHRIFEFCGTMRSPVVLTSSTESLFIGFKSDSTITYIGFAGTVERINNNDCQHEIRANGGYIYSRNFLEYPDPKIINCTWNIFVDKYRTIAIEFMETPRLLCYLYLQLGRTNKVFEIWEGKTLLASCDITSSWDTTVVTTGNHLTIKYKTDTDPPFDGNWFSLKFEADCKFVAADRIGIINTPSIIAGSGQLVNCSWKIISPENDAGILVLFTQLNWAVRGSNCMDQFVRVGIPSNESAPLPLFHDCCGHPPGPLYSSDGGLILDALGGIQVETLFAQIPFHCNANTSNAMLDKTTFSLEDDDCILSFGHDSGTRIKLITLNYNFEIHQSKCYTGFVEVYGTYFFANLEKVYCQTNIPTSRNTTDIQYWVVYIEKH